MDADEPTLDHPVSPERAAASEPARPFRSVTLAVIGVVAVLLVGAGIQSYGDLARARERQHELETRLEETRRRIESLEVRIERLREDPVLLERLAREELGLARPGERVIVLPEEEAAAGDPAETRDPTRPPDREPEASGGDGDPSAPTRPPGSPAEASGPGDRRISPSASLPSPSPRSMRRPSIKDPRTAP